MLVGRQFQGLFEEIEKRGLARVTRANDKDTRSILELDPSQQLTVDSATYLYGVGSLRRRSRRGLLTVLTALLA